MVDVNRMTHKVQEALQQAGGIATRRNHQGVDVEHLLLALLDAGGRPRRRLLERPASPRAPCRTRRARARPPPAGHGRRRAARPGLRHAAARQAPRQGRGRGRRSRTSTSASSTCCSRCSTRPAPSAGRSSRSGSRATSSWRRSQSVRGNQRVTSQNPEADLRGAREVRPRPDRARRARASSTRSSAATRRSAASSRCCRAAPRTTRC